MSTRTAPDGGVLLAGGYGVVGTKVAELLRRHHPALRLVIAGRTLGAAKALAERLGNAEGVALDTKAADPLQGIAKPLLAVAGLVSDADDNLLRAAMTRGIAYLDITRGVAAQSRAYVTAALGSARAPVMFASNWMAGVPAILTVHAARGIDDVDTVALFMLFDQKDKTGPDSADAGSDLAESFIARVDGAWRRVGPMSDPLRVRFPSGRRRTGFRMNMADVTTLAHALGARDVAVRICLDSDLAARTMRFLIRTGLFRLTQKKPSSEPAKSPSYNPKAKGAAHEIVVEISGRAGGAPAKRSLTILDPHGQAHLTALGAVANLERVLGLTGEPLRPGIAVPETAPDGVRLLALLREEGVSVVADPAM